MASAGWASLEDPDSEPDDSGEPGERPATVVAFAEPHVDDEAGGPHEFGHHRHHHRAESPLESPLSRAARGAPGHHIHTNLAHQSPRRHPVDRHHELRLPAYSPGGTLRSPGGTELFCDDDGVLSSPMGTVRPGMLASPGGTVRPGVLKDNWVEGGWAPMTREQLRKGDGVAKGKERAWFAGDVKDVADSVASSAQARRLHDFILARRSDHHRLSTAHQQLIAVGHTGTTGLESDWGGLQGGHLTWQAALRFVSCLITIVDSVVLANRPASRNPYHPRESDAQGAQAYGWGPAKKDASGAYFDVSLLAFLVWDILVSAAITAEILGRHWHIPAGYVARWRQHGWRLRRGQRWDAETGMRSDVTWYWEDSLERAQRLAREAEAEESGEVEEVLSAEELESRIKDEEERLKVLRHELDVLLLSTKPASLVQMLLVGRNAEDKAQLKTKRGEIVDGALALANAQQALSTLRQGEAEQVHLHKVLTLNPQELEHSLKHAVLELKVARRQRGDANYLLFRRKTREQTQAILSLETKVTELTSDLELLRTHRAESTSASGGGRDSKPGSPCGSEAAELHIAGEVQVNAPMSACVRAHAWCFGPHIGTNELVCRMHRDR